MSGRPSPSIGRLCVWLLFLSVSAYSQEAILDVPLTDRPSKFSSEAEIAEWQRRLEATETLLRSSGDAEGQRDLLDAVLRSRAALARVQSVQSRETRQKEVERELAERIRAKEAELQSTRAEARATRERLAAQPREFWLPADTVEALRARLSRLQQERDQASAELSEARARASEAAASMELLRSGLVRRKAERDALLARLEVETREALQAEANAISQDALRLKRESAHVSRLEHLALGLEVSQDEARLQSELPARLKAAELEAELKAERASLSATLFEALRVYLDDRVREESEARSNTRADYEQRLAQNSQQELKPRYEVEIAILDAQERAEWAADVVVTYGSALPAFSQSVPPDRLSLDAARLRDLRDGEAKRIQSLEEELELVRELATRARADRLVLYEKRGEVESFLSMREEETILRLEDPVHSAFFRQIIKDRFADAAVRYRKVLDQWNEGLTRAEGALQTRFDAVEARIAERRQQLRRFADRLLWLQDESRMSWTSLSMLAQDVIGLPDWAKRHAQRITEVVLRSLKNPERFSRIAFSAGVVLLMLSLAWILRRRLPNRRDWLLAKGEGGVLRVLLQGLRESSIFSAVAFAFLACCSIWDVGVRQTGLLGIAILTPFFYRFFRVLLDILFMPESKGARFLPMDDVVASTLHRSLLWFLRILTVFVPVGLTLGWYGYDRSNPGFLQAWWFAQTLALAAVLLLGACRPSILKRLISGQGELASSARALLAVLYPLIIGAVFFLLYLNAFRYQEAVTYFRTQFVNTIIVVAVAYIVYGWALRRFLPNRDFYRIIRREDFDDDPPYIAAGRSLFLDRSNRLLLRLMVVVPSVLILSGLWSDLDMSFLDGTFFTGGTLTARQLFWGAFIVFVTATVVRHYRRGMRFVVLPTTTWDKGLQYAVLTLTSYFLFALGIVICLNVIQVKGDQIAYVLSALAVGIGFGLKDIVTNFVSGLILLIERPLKVGDQVEIGTQVGLVETINLRSTTIMTFDQVGVVVPNAELVSQTLVNRSAGAPIVRTRVNVGVS